MMNHTTIPYEEGKLTAMDYRISNGTLLKYKGKDGKMKMGFIGERCARNIAEKRYKDKIEKALSL